MNSVLSTVKTATSFLATPQHNRLLLFFRRSQRFGRYYFQRWFGNQKRDINIPQYRPDQMLYPIVPLHPEYAAYTFHLSGFPQRLLTYIIFFELNADTGKFPANTLMKSRLKEYCALFGDVPSDETIRKALANLVSNNVILSVQREQYMLNPLIAGGRDREGRKLLIKEYCGHLLKKGKNATDDFYPRYS